MSQGRPRRPVSLAAVAPLQAARPAVGVLVPLVIGELTGHLELGAFAALGAFPAGLVSFQGVARTRVGAVAVAAFGIAASTFIGASIAASDRWLLVPAVTAFGYVTGIAVCLGQRPSVVVLQWPAAMLIAVGLPLGPAQAALRAGLVLAGGLFQGALVVSSWVVRPGTTERAALADAYRSLAGYAADVAAGRFDPPAAAPFTAPSVLADPNPLLSGVARLELLDLLELAERIRASLAALALHAAGDDAAARQIRSLADDTSNTLLAIAAALTARTWEQAAPPALTVPSDAPWRWAGEALLGQLRALATIMSRLGGVGARSLPSIRAADRTVREPSALTQTLALLRANMNLSSEAGRHALRLAVVAGLAAILVEATDLEEGRWVVLTIFLVLRPDYGSTMYRGARRAAGTLLGAALGTAAAQLGGVGHGGLIAAAGMTVALAYALFGASFLLFSVFLTAFVVLILRTLGTPALATAEWRLIDTAIGCLFGLAAYLVWPTWEGLTAREKFARLIEAHRDYSTALLRALAEPAHADSNRLRKLQAAARLSRSEAQGSIARLGEEPRRHGPLTPVAARSLMAPVLRLAHAELALHALQSMRQGGHGETERLNALADASNSAMTELATALRRLRPPASIPALRPIQAGLPESSSAADPNLVAATDGLVDAVNTLDAALRNWLRRPDAASPSLTPTRRNRRRARPGRLRRTA